MQPSIFTKIINGEIPCHKIYEDDQTLAFLDIYSPQLGHTLVIPKKQIEFLWDLDDEDYATLMATVKRVARHMRETLGVKYVGVKVVGTDVPHTHVHLIPFDDAQEYSDAQPAPHKAPSDEELAAMAKTLAF